MTMQEAREILDSTIPEPCNNMVDLGHLSIAVAWDTIKRELDNMAPQSGR